MCFLDTATVAIIDGYDTNWYEVRSGAPSTTLPELMSVLFSLTECSFGNVTIPYAESEDSARVAQNYGAAVVEYMAQLTPDNACRPQDFQTVSVEVTDERWDETPVVLITYTYAVQVEPDKSHGCWIAGGGGTPGTGALEGYTICGSGIRLEAADGIWQCTGIST